MDWMKLSIDITKNLSDEGLRVGVIAVSKEDEMLSCISHVRGSDNLWSISLMNELKGKGIEEVESLYLTVNTVINDFCFELNLVRKAIAINKVYIGLPDPLLSIYVSEDPAIHLPGALRYPDNLKCEIMWQNMPFYLQSKQNIVFSPHYFENRISTQIISRLSELEMDFSLEEIRKNGDFDTLAMLLSNRYNMDIREARNLLRDVLSEAFDKKYSGYDYDKDVRSVYPEWSDDFFRIYDSYTNRELCRQKILNVGVGGGNEAVLLFSKCNSIVFTDIAYSGLEYIKSRIPQAYTFVSRAEDLYEMSDNAYDVYISLRTYNSSFFDIEGALSEAKRVLKSGGIFMISIANGFLCADDHRIIPGLIIPQTNFVDLYRAIDEAREILNSLSQLGFYNLSMVPTSSEIYLLAQNKL